MIFYLLPIALIVGGLVAIVYIVFNNFSSIRTLNVETMPVEKEMKVKNRIILERLKRNVIDLKKKVFDFFHPALIDLGEMAGKFYDRVMELEREIVSRKKLTKSGFDRRKEVDAIIAKAQELIAEEKFNEAEAEYISALELDNKNIEVYHLLVNLYLESKDMIKAQETGEYLLKLAIKAKDKRELASAYADLAWIYLEEKKPKKALQNIRQAIKIEPSNPRFLDLFLKISIILKNKKLALRAFSSLKDADPDNQKLGELKEQIGELG